MHHVGSTMCTATPSPITNQDHTSHNLQLQLFELYDHGECSCSCTYHDNTLFSLATRSHPPTAHAKDVQAAQNRRR